jgi:DNA polymerase epsilon subunit 4
MSLAHQLTPAVARVQKIIQADPERLTTSKNAAFAIALATEMFIQHLATRTHEVVKSERKPRRNIQYRDVGTAVAKTDNLEFLVDVVPRTDTWGRVEKKIREKEREAKRVGKKGRKGGKGQTTLDGKMGAANGDQEDEEDEEEEGSEKATSPVANGDHAESSPLSEKLDETPTAEDTPDAMEIDEQERVEASEPEVDDAAMQIEMEMRGPPRQATASVSVSASASPEVKRSSGFTAINGSK